MRLTTVEAKRIASTLDKAVNIQATRRKDTIPSSPLLLQEEVQPEQKQLTTLERRLEICRYIYRIIKQKHPDIPKYRKSKINAFRSEKTCNSISIGNAFAHAHNRSSGFDRKYQFRICIKQKYLLDPLYRKHPKYPIKDTNLQNIYENMGDMMAHEIAHLKINSCSHCRKWRERYETLNKTIISSIRSGEFIRNLPVELHE